MLRALAKLIGENKGETPVNRAVEINKTRLKLGTITLDGVDDWDRKWLLKLAGLQEHTVVSGVQINNALSLFTGTQAFSQITYTLTKNQDTEIAPERIRLSAISRACSPLSGWEISKVSTFTPSFLA